MEPTEFRRKSIAQRSLFKPHPLRQATFKALFSPTHRRHWVGGLAAAGLICLAPTAAGQVLELSDLNGRNGFKINGESTFDFSGTSVSGAGDINGDCIDDVVIGARNAGANGIRSGVSYVVFGSDQGFSTPFELYSINGSNGIKIIGESVGDYLGRSVSSAGDVNGDGIDDLIIGARHADPNGSRSGASYVVFGSDQGFTTPIELSSLDGSNGFKINGEAIGDQSGASVSKAGDVNGDGIDDVIIGSRAAGYYAVGASHVIFGSDQIFSTPIELSNLDGSDGFKINGEGGADVLGSSVSAAGDVNGDGFDDLILGAPRIYTYLFGRYPGASYILFGTDQGFDTPIELSGLNVTNGFKIAGEQELDRSGGSVSAAGDINDDGIDDLIIGASGIELNGRSSGASYVVFGSDHIFSTPLELASLNGSNGFEINGEVPFYNLGHGVSGAGDINGDGIDDVIIGAIGAGSDPVGFGAVYVVFGNDQKFSTPFELMNLDGDNGFRLIGEVAKEISESSVSSAGDINGDGIDDVIIGASRADPNGLHSGASYVVFGSPTIGQVTTIPMMVALGDINGDGSQDVAVLVHDEPAKTLTATVKNVEYGSLVQQISFSSNFRPVDLKVMDDINGNSTPELVVLGKGLGMVQAEVRDSLTGALLGTVDYDPDVKPIELEVVHDQDSSGIPELAVLGEDLAQVEVRDALTGNLVNTVTYTDNVTPKDLLVLPDLNGVGGPDIGVLGEDINSNKGDRVEIRDLLTGQWVHKLTYGKYEVHQAKLVDDLNNNRSPEIAVLRTSNEGKVNVLIKDAVTRAFVQGIGYDRNYAPEELLIVPDVNGNGASEIAVFGKNPNNGTQKVQVRDGKTKEWISNVFYDKTVVPDDVAVMPDVNGNGAPEIGLLGTRINGNLLRLIIKDSKTGKLVATVFF